MPPSGMGGGLIHRFIGTRLGPLKLIDGRHDALPDMEAFRVPELKHRVGAQRGRDRCLFQPVRPERS